MRRDRGEGELQCEVFEPEQDGGGSCQTVCCLFVVIPSHNGSVYVCVGLIHRFNINDLHLFTGTVPANRGCEINWYIELILPIKKYHNNTRQLHVRVWI